MREIFGTMPEGDVVERVTLQAGGLSAKILTYGAVLQDLRLEGHAAPLVLGYETLADYINHSPFFGATPGRVANRIGKGRFSLDGTLVQVELNENNRTHLHGGSDGMATRNWQIVALGQDHVSLEITDPAGRAGYPGTVKTLAHFSLKPGGVLSIVYETTTDAPTPANICHHSYFNLDGATTILDHEIMIAADHYLPVDADLIPLGQAQPVSGTGFDFRVAAPLAYEEQGRQMIHDHNFCLSSERVEKRFVAKLHAPRSGVSLSVFTTEPGMQLYTGGYIGDRAAGLDGRRYGPFAGLCLETQIWPDAINQPHFPKALLLPQETLRQETDYVFTKDNAV